MSRYLAASIGLSDGRVIRVGPDEDQVGDIPTNFTFQTQMPGGFGPASLTIPRPPDLYADDAKLFSDVVVYGEGMRIIYEGYVTGLPQQSQDEIQLQITGWSSVLERIQNFRQIFVDRDLSKWRAPSEARRLELMTPGTVKSVSAPVLFPAAETTVPALYFQDTSGQVATIETWFDAGPGLTIKRLRVEGTVSVFGTIQIGLSNSDASVSGGQSISASGTNQQANLPKTLTTTIPRRYAYLSLTSTAGPFDQYPIAIINRIAVYGNHSLILSGSEPASIYGSEAIAYMVGATPLNIFPDSIEPSEITLPHLSFLDDISVRGAIEQINLFGGRELLPNDWGVYENREFFWQSPGTYGKTWLVSGENLTNVRSDGPDSLLRTSGVKVNYQNEAGVTRAVGPPNSFSDFETSELLSIDADNPAFKLPGYHAETVGITSQQGAVNIGKVILNERNRLNWRGDLELQGEVLDSEGKTYPVHRIRAGDQIIVQDDDDKRPRPVNSTSYSHDNLSLTASLGAVPDRLDTLLARLAAVTDLFV